MIKKVQPKVLSETEEKLLNALKVVDTVGFAADKVGIKTKTAYNILYRLRKKYIKARRFVNVIEAQKRSHNLATMVLTDRMQERELEEEPQEEEAEAEA